MINLQKRRCVMSRQEMFEEARNIAQEAAVFSHLEPDQQTEAIEYIMHDLEERIYGHV